MDHARVTARSDGECVGCSQGTLRRMMFPIRGSPAEQRPAMLLSFCYFAFGALL